MNAKKSANFWLCVSLCICLVSAVGASVVQTDKCAIKYTELTFIGDSGNRMTALLLVPKNATVQTPAPAIICSHGWYNNKEMQDLNYVEYARRGFVVMSINMYGHGDSEVIEAGTWWKPENNANGMYDAVKYMARLPYVDASRIGVTGHSNGAQASREAVLLDSKADKALIAAVLLVCNDANYTREVTMAGGVGLRRIYDPSKDTYYNMFGARSAGIVACQYDEFFHGVTQADGSYSAPRDYINQPTAQSFLNFGRDPAGLEARKSYELYRENVDGKEVVRAIFNPDQIHPWAHFSKSVVASSVEFFNAALDAPIKLDPNDQIWQWKDFFNAIGIVGFFMFVIYFAVSLLYTDLFSSLRYESALVEAQTLQPGRGKWFWGGLLAAALFGIAAYPTIFRWCNASRPAFFNQPATYYIAWWSLLCGAFTIFMMLLSCKSIGKSGFDAKGCGASLAGKFWKTILLSLVVTIGAYLLVFAAHWLFLTDFRLWCFTTLRAFTADKFAVIWKFAPFYLVYYVALSVSTNCFNNVKIGPSWMNLVVLCLAVILGPVIMIAVQYGYFFNTGYLLTEAYNFGGSIIGIWLFPFLVYLPVAVLVSRKIYKYSNNPYIGGIVMGLIVTIVSCTNTLTYLIK